MDKARFSKDFKRNAVLQTVDRAYPVAEVSKRSRASAHSLHGWMKRLSDPNSSRASDEQAAEAQSLVPEILRL